MPEEKKMPEIKRSKFGNVDKHVEQTELLGTIKDLIKALMSMRFIRTYTQREETVRLFRYALDSKKMGVAEIPRFTGGDLGSKHNNVVECLYSELACLVHRYWEYMKDPTEPNKEAAADHVEYLYQVLQDQVTLRTIDLGNGRYRITNSRIMNGFKMVED